MQSYKKENKCRFEVLAIDKGILRERRPDGVHFNQAAQQELVELVKRIVQHSKQGQEK